jgi:hypothetical protein
LKEGRSELGGDGGDPATLGSRFRRLLPSLLVLARRRTLFVPLVLALILARLAFDSDDDARLAALFVMAVIFSAAWRQLRIGERLRGHADGGRT